jgi:hypothetical protein
MGDIRHYAPLSEEPQEITAMRERYATEVRDFVRRYAQDQAVSDGDFAYSLHLLTYRQAKELAKRSLELWADIVKGES